jgi:hypothetical protein
MAHVKELVNLQVLTLGSTQVTDAGLEHLKGLAKLKILSLSNSKGVTDAGLEHLKGMSSLRQLSLWGTGCTKEAFDELRKALPDCNIVGEEPPPDGSPA